MLYLSRKVGEAIMIDDDIEIEVVSVRSGVVKLGFRFPIGVAVLRKELYERIRAENREAVQAAENTDAFVLPDLRGNKPGKKEPNRILFRSRQGGAKETADRGEAIEQRGKLRGDASLEGGR